MHSKCLPLLGTFFVLWMEVLPLNNVQAHQQIPAGFELAVNNKYFLVVIIDQGKLSWNQASRGCQSFRGSLFVADNEHDSKWLGRKINDEKERGYRSPSKFWIGLESHGANGPLKWINGREYIKYSQVVQVSGYDDENKRYAWAVPDGVDGPVDKIKYEFLTVDDLAEAYICQFPPA